MAEAGQTLLDNLKLAVPDLKDLPISPEIKHIDKTASAVIDQLPGVALNLSIGIVIILLGWMASGWLATWLNRMLNRLHMEETLAAFLASTARFTLFFTVFVTGITIVGVSSTSIAAILGAIGLAVGIAMRATLANAAAGFLLIAHRLFKVGDYLENSANGVTVTGTVKRIGLFSTEVNTLDFVRVFVPNALLWENVLRNHTYNRMHMTDGSFLIAYAADVPEVLRAVKAALMKHRLVLKTPEPVVEIMAMNEHGITCKAEVWTRSEDRKVMKDEILTAVMAALVACKALLPGHAAANKVETEVEKDADEAAARDNMVAADVPVKNKGK